MHMLKTITRWRRLCEFRRRVAQLPEHERLMRELRWRAANDVGTTEEMYALAERAYVTAPNEIERARITNWLRPLEHGRRVRVKSARTPMIDKEIA